MYIEFKELKFKNFMSYGNKFSTYSFNKGMDLVMGANGSGKSSIVEALTFALFGKAFRKSKLGSLVNDITDSNTEVHCTFLIQNEEYKIIRCIKPNSFEIYKNDTLIPQEATVKEYQRYLENYIININESTFRQLIVLGANISSSKPFLELSSSEKEDVFNTVIDTKIFTYMLDVIKEKLNMYKTYKLEYEYKIDILQNSITSEESNIQNIQNKNIEFNKSHITKEKLIEEQIKECLEGIEKTQYFIGGIKKIKVVYDKETESLKSTKEEYQKVQERLHNLNSSIKQIESIVSSHSVCVGCDNLIKISGVDVTKESEIRNSVQDSQEKLIELDAALFNIQNKINTLYENMLKAKNQANKKVTLESKLQSLRNELNDIENFKYIEIDHSNLERLNEEYKITKSSLSTLNDNVQRLQNLKNIISNKSLKGTIISKQLPILNKYINKYIEKFSTSQFNMIIQDDFSEKIVTSRGVQKEFTQLSNGQKMRLTFSLIFAFLKFIEEKNAITFNVLIADEVLDTSVDFNGREELIGILYNEFANDKNIIIISHNPEIKEKTEIFRRIINITKENNFSKMDLQ